LKFIRDVSFPKQRKEAKEGALFPISNAPRYPTAAQVHNTLRQARLTETELAVEHVEMLLDVLVLDGEVEKLPAFGTQLWDSNAIEDGDSADEHDGPSKKKKKRRRSSSSDEDEAEVKTKRKKKRVDTDSDDEEEDSSRKKSKLKRRKGDDSDDSGSDAPKKKKKKKRNDSDESDSDDASSRKKKKKKKKNESDEESDSDDGARGKKKKKKKKDDSDDESDSDAPTRKKKKKVKKESSDSESDDDRGRRTKSVKRSPSPFNMFDSEYSGGVVYRAVNQEKITLGWSEAPCSKCPSFEFCKEGGPVNAKECVYYEDWLVAGTVAFDDES